MKLEEKTKSSLTSTNTKSDTIKANNANVEASKSKKVLSKKNSLDDDEKLKKEADNQQTEISEENQTTTDSKDTAISNGIKVAAADTTTLDTATGAGNSSSTGVTGQSSGISNYAFAGLLGLGAIGIAAASSSGGGGGGHATPSGPATDTTSPTLVTTSRNNPAQTITLTFSENLDPAHLPPSSAFGISLNNNPIFDAIPMGSSIAIGAANQLVITFPIGTFTAGDTIAIRYTDPSAANDSNALQDATGNDTENFTTTSFSVIDGYIRNAKIYIDSNNNGIAENSEYTGVVTDDNGNFFLPEKRPAGGIIAIGGVNIDTGVANTIEFKAPAESSVVTPLTTIIQAYMAANKVDSANAEKAIKAALGISDNIDLLNYDPLAEPSNNADALAVQKIAASIATIITLAAGTDNAKENTVFNNLATAIKDANSGASIIDFTDTDTLDKILSNTDISSQAVSDATTAINNANTFEDISDAQSDALDNISPGKPILLGLADSTDTGIKGDAITNISSSIVRVSFDTTATDGTAAVKDDNITIYNSNIPVGTANLTASDILNGYADIPTQLTAGNNSLTAQITDGALHKSTYSTTINIVLDTTPPNAPSINLVADTSDGATGHDADNITNNANLIFSAAAADVTRTYAINNGAAGSSYIAPTTDGTYTVLVTDTDTAGNSASSSLTFTLKTSITTPTITLTTDSTDGATGHDADNITNNANLIFSAAAADVTRTYTVNAGTASSSYIAPTIDGTYTVTVADADVAGNVSSSSITFTLDKSVDTPVWTNATGGVLGSDGVVNTNDSTPAIGGTAEAGVTINVYNALGSASLAEGALLGTVVAGADGKWSLQLPQLPDGDYRARAEAVDAAGNVSALAVGPLLRVDATNNPADSAQPYLVNASFTESDNATITLTFNEPIQIANITPPYMWSGINITEATVTNNTVTLTTNETFTATDTLELNHFDLSQIGIKNLAGNYALYRDTIICGSSDNELAVPYYNSYEIFTGNGADVIKVGERDDVVTLTETIKSSDRVIVNGDDEASTWALMDNVIGFDVSGTVTNDKLDLPTSAIANNTSGFINGTDAGSIKSHSISNGILTFGATDTGTAIVINESNITDVINYLTSNITIPGLAAGIEIDTDANGSVDSLIVYQQQGGDIEDVAIMLSGITGATLGNTAGNNVVEITDSQGPIANYPVISNNTITFSFNEVISSYDLTGLSFKHGNGQTITPVTVTGSSNSGNEITLTTDTTFGANDYLLTTASKGTSIQFTDNNGNTAGSNSPYSYAEAIGGIGNTIIDLSALGYYDNSTIADIAGGDDTLISGKTTFIELDGGIGNDFLDARLSANADLFGGDGNDILYGGQFSNEYTGGKDADRMIGSSDPQSEDYFLFKQGDSTSVSFTDQGNTGLGNGDTFVFNGGADIILAGLDPLADGAFYGDSISLYSNSYNYNDIDLSKMASIPLDGLVTDQGYFFQQGSYAEASGIFTVNDTGADALIVYDGDSSNGVSQTALVLANTNSAYLATDTWGSIYLDTPPMG